MRLLALAPLLGAVLAVVPSRPLAEDAAATAIEPSATPTRSDAPPTPDRPKPRLRWLADATTGRALGGFDPVAYFLRGAPTMGDTAHQLEWGGVTWLFADEGTLAAFRDAPQVYAPMFGGRCAFGVSQGRPAEGSPQWFLVHRNRLLLFADAAARTAFLLDPDRLLAEAVRRWPAILDEWP